MSIVNFIKENAEWIGPLFLALISAIFGVSKHKVNKRKQTINNIRNSSVININGDVKGSSINNKNK